MGMAVFPQSQGQNFLLLIFLPGWLDLTHGSLPAWILDLARVSVRLKGASASKTPGCQRKACGSSRTGGKQPVFPVLRAPGNIRPTAPVHAPDAAGDAAEHGLPPGGLEQKTTRVPLRKGGVYVLPPRR